MRVPIVFAALVATATPAAAVTLECLIEPDMVIEIATPVEGVVEEVAVDRGQRVRKGEVVAHLEASLEEIAVEMARQRAADDSEVRAAARLLDNERVRLQRTETLHQRGTAADAVRDDARMTVEVREIEHDGARRRHAMAQVELRRAEAMLERRSIRSPIDGVVLQILLHPGEFAHEQANIVRVARVDPLWVEAFAPLSLYGRIAVGDPVVVRPVEPIGGAYEGRVDVIDPVFDAASGTFGIRIVLPNPGERIPSGLRCTADLAEPS